MEGQLIIRGDFNGEKEENEKADENHQLIERNSRSFNINNWVTNPGGNFDIINI